MTETTSGLLSFDRRAFSVVEISGVIFNLTEIAVDCGVNPTRPDVDIVLQAWKHYGAALAKQIRGDFALKLLSPATNRTVLITDPVGSRPCYYTCQNGACSSGFSPVDLLNKPDLRFSKNVDWIAQYLTGQYDQRKNDQTAYNEIFRLPPASIATFTGGVLDSIETYEPWDIEQVQNKAADSDWVKAHKTLFEQAIARRMDHQNPMAAENSGGLDSASVITFVSHKASQTERDSFQTVSSLRWKIELDWIPMVNKAAGIKNHAWTQDAPSLASVLDIENRVKGFPFEVPLEIPTDSLKELSSQGSKIVFSGFGGDETVTQHGYIYQYEAIGKLDIKSLWAFTGRHPIKKWYRLARLIWENTRNSSELTNIKINAVRSSYLGDQLVIDQLCDAITLDDIEHAKQVRTMNGSVRHALRFKSSFQDRLQDHTLYARAFGMRYSWPLLDYDLLRNFMSTPSLQRVKPGKTYRYLHRRAVRGIVPDEIIDSDTKKMGAMKMSPAWFQKKHQDILDYGRDALKSLAEPLASMVDSDKIAAEIEKFETQVSVEENREVIIFWDKMRRVISLNHWCIHGR